MENLADSFQLQPNAMGHLTSTVQLGFIIGTLVFAFLTIADRYSPSKVFFISAVLASAFNLGTISSYNSFESLLGLRLFDCFQ